MKNYEFISFIIKKLKWAKQLSNIIKPKLDNFLQQGMKDSISYNDCLTQLAALTQAFVNS